MPIFDYKCGNCDKEQEVLVLKNSDPILCKECNSSDMHKQVSATKAFRLYGEGFYRRDHKDTGDWGGD